MRMIETTRKKGKSEREDEEKINFYFQLSKFLEVITI